MSEEQLVREANERFYRAMNAADAEQMDAVWSGVATDVCVHPGREAIFGYERIRESFAMIFSAENSMSIVASNEHIVIHEEIAWVACTETISIMMEDGLDAAAAQATNIFQRTNGAWRMVVHHASPIPFTTQDDWPDVIN